jgi:hypothetical protein
MAGTDRPAAVFDRRVRHPETILIVPVLVPVPTRTTKSTRDAQPGLG